MVIVLSLRNGWLAALLAVASALLAPAPSFASNTQPVEWTSEGHSAMGHEECPGSEMPTHSRAPAGVGVDCCHWMAAADTPGLAVPNGSDPASAPARALPAIPAVRAPAVYSPLHASAAGSDLIVLFGRFRE